jgi:coatomer protein complex subunit gamma
MIFNQSCLDDVDDEVRDRAALYLQVFRKAPLADVYVKEGELDLSAASAIDPALDSVFSISTLESKLVAYVKDPEASRTPFDVSSVPKISRAQAAQDAAREWVVCFPSLSIHCLVGPSTLDTIGVLAAKKASASPPPPSAAERQSAYAKQLAEVPELSSYGPVLNSSTKPAQLTENETEYQVTCVKHIFKEHIVFQVRSVYFLFRERI